MNAEMEWKWALAKAELLKVQAAFLTITVYRCTTYEDLKKKIQENIAELESMAQELREEAAKIDPDRN